LSTREAQALGDTSRFFTGRQDILERLDACFAVRDTGGKPRREFLLYGMGGVGKTQIALKAADDLEDRYVAAIPFDRMQAPSRASTDRSGNRFKHIFHVDGTDAVTASQSYASICQKQLLGYGTTNEMRDLALRWIEGLSDEWLMIYDNCPEQERFQPILPRRNKGNVIYTSRSQGFQADIPTQWVCEVKPLEEDDAVDLLLKIAGHEHLRTDPEEIKSSREIVASVGYLPLAIESAGAYIREGGCNALTYLQRFHDQQERPQLLSKPNVDGSLPVRPALYTALDLSYEAIVGVRRRKGRSVMGRAAECALQILNLLCFYHNEKIPALILQRAATERLKWGSLGVYPLSDLADDPFMDATLLLALDFPEGTWNDTRFSLGVQVLQRFSLVKLSPNRRYVSMHVMVQAWAQDRMDDHTRERQALAARMVLIESMVLSWKRHEAAWMRLIATHINACLAHKAAPVRHDPYQAILDYKLGWYYTEDKQFTKAIEHLSNALRIWKLEKGAHSESVTTVLSDLANVYHDMGRAGDAELTYREVLERLRRRLDDLRTESREQRARAKARAWAKRRGRSEEMAHFPRHRESVAEKDKAGKAENGNPEDEKTEDEEEKDIQNHADGIGATGGAPKVEQWDHDVLSVVQREPRQQTIQDLRFELANISTRMARLLFDYGRFAAGRELVLSAIEYLNQTDEPDDIRVWALEDELIRVFQLGGDLDHWMRRTSALRALSRDKYEGAAAHDYSFVWQIGYACYLFNEGSWEEAYASYSQLLELAPMCYGVGDRRTLYLLRKMALCQLERGLFEEAEELARTAIERAKAAYGQWHLYTAKCLGTLSFVLMSQTLDVRPGSEFWTVTQEAYESAQIALSEDHYLTSRLKQRLDTFRYPQSNPTAHGSVEEEGEEEESGLIRNHKPKETGGVADNSDDFFDYIDRKFADGYPETKEEYMAIVNAEYREYTRKELQARSKKNKTPPGETPNTGTQAEPESRVLTNTQRAENEPAAKGCSRPSRQERRERWRGKQKANVTLSPILEGEPPVRREPAQQSSSTIEVEPGESRGDLEGKREAPVFIRDRAEVHGGKGTSEGAVFESDPVDAPNSSQA
jgi:tetratricopeptide (TPR) repeat protein